MTTRVMVEAFAIAHDIETEQARAMLDHYAVIVRAELMAGRVVPIAGVGVLRRGRKKVRRLLSPAEGGVCMVNADVVKLTKPASLEQEKRDDADTSGE